MKLKSRNECDCACHSTATVVHVVACCDAPYQRTALVRKKVPADVSRAQEAMDLADMLELLQAGKLSEREFRTAYEACALKGIIATIWPNLEHYLSDGDIRLRDSNYRAMQEAELMKLIALLRAGEPDSVLASVHFLGRSKTQ